MRETGRILFFIFIFLAIGTCPRKVKAEAVEQTGIMDWQDSISLEEVERVFQDMQGEGGTFSLEDYMGDVWEGRADFSLGEIWSKGAEHVANQFHAQRNVLFRVLALGLLAGIFIRFAGTMGDRNVGETGFYIVYFLLFATITSGFYAVYQVAADALHNLLDFMKVLVPSFSLALAMGTETMSGTAYYESMLIGISLLENLMTYILLPGVQVYFLLGMMNQLADNHFSRLTELIRSVLGWSLKILFGVMLGYQGIQGLLLPVIDRVKNNTVLQTAKGLPGVGNTIGGVADTVWGSSILIKSALGVGGLLCILILCFYPAVKLAVFTLLYRIGAAIVQPVSDPRVSSALHTASESGKLLLGYITVGALMFLLSIIIVLVCTNML